MNAIHQLLTEAKMTWMQEEQGWIVAPDDIVDALTSDGFVECKRATTTSRRDLRPTGGLWQGVNNGTGAVASTIWVERPFRARIIVFVTIDGEPLDRSTGAESRPARSDADVPSRPAGNSEPLK
jgi:hypothetical protein